MDVFLLACVYMVDDRDKHNHPTHSHQEHVCHHDDHDHDHDHEQVCGQCGKLHSKYFIENHHCICQTLFNIPSKDFEECIISNLHTRAPPASIYLNIKK